MEQVEHITFGNKSAQAALEIGYGRFVVRHSAGKIEQFGGLNFDNMQTQWSPEANVTIDLEDPSPINGICNKIIVDGAFGTGLAASRNSVDPATDLAWDLSPYAAIGFFAMCSKAMVAGEIRLGVSATADLGGTPVYMDIPAMEAGLWYYHSVAFSGAGTAREAIVSAGLNVVTDNGAFDLYLDDIGVGALFHGIAGQAALNEIVERCATADVWPEGRAVNVIVSGMAKAQLAAGITCVAEQKLFPIPGGKLTTTPVIMPGRTIEATEDMSDAAGTVGVLY